MLTIAIVGTGLMGAGIAKVIAGQDHRVTLYDTDADTAAQVAVLLGATAHRELADAVGSADVIIEAVVEQLPVKQQLFATIDALNPEALLATNTSVLPVTEIARYVGKPDRVVGTHWWNPPDVMPLVEVIRGEHTTDDAVARAENLLVAPGKIPVRVERDVPGFIGNRLQHALWREAIALVADRICDAKTVDLVVRNTIGLRLAAMGPLENADYIGLDLTLAIHEAVLSSLNREPSPSPLLRRLVQDRKLGARTGEGFVSWPPGARDAAARRLTAHIAKQLEGARTQ
ncbi:MAG: 3-hydroxyacyl-CoA dehydrogenase family protein [Mycobacterium sp.]